MTITNGVVSIEDGAKAQEEFAPARKVRVELSFDVAEGSDPVAALDSVRALVSSRVALELGRSVKTTVAAAPVVVEPAKPKGETVLDQVTGEVKATAKKGAKKKAAETPEPGSKADLEAKAIAAATKPTAAAAEIEEEDDGEELTDAGNIDDLLGDAAPAPITDAELAKAAQLRNALLKQKFPNEDKVVLIRKLIVEYAGQPPKKITDIPVAKRQEFLDKLNALE